MGMKVVENLCFCRSTGKRNYLFSDVKRETNKRLRMENKPRQERELYGFT